MTESENRLWRQLRAHRLNGEKFRRQQPIGVYVVDFVHFGSRLIVEADGGQHNGAPHDEQRDHWLRQQGFTVMRFWNNEIMGNLEGVLATIMNAVMNPPSPPTPLPQGERGDSGSVRPEGDADLKPLPSRGKGVGENPPAPMTQPAQPHLPVRERIEEPPLPVRERVGERGSAQHTGGKP